MESRVVPPRKHAEASKSILHGASSGGTTQTHADGDTRCGAETRPPSGNALTDSPVHRCERKSSRARKDESTLCSLPVQLLKKRETHGHLERESVPQKRSVKLYY